MKYNQVNAPLLTRCFCTDCIEYEWHDSLLRFSHQKLEYGKGKEIDFDFSKIEVELSPSLVAGKALLGIIACVILSIFLTSYFSVITLDFDDIEEFAFHLELFHGCGSILHGIFLSFFHSSGRA